MSNTNTSTAAVGGTSFLNLLFLTFLVLKLTKVIDWSWWWVTAPLWIPIGLIVVLAAMSGVVVFVCELISRRKR